MPASVSTIHSLRRKLLLPLLLAGCAVAVFAIWRIQLVAQHEMGEKLRERAELVAHLVNSAAEGISRPGELQRLVCDVGAEREILDIVVVGGRPTRVLASTKNAWLHKPLVDLPEVDMVEDLAKSIRTRGSHYHMNAANQIFDFSSTLLLSQPELADRSLSEGAVLVRLDTRLRNAAIRDLTLRLGTALMIGLTMLTALGYGLLNSLVLRPVAAIGNLVRQRGEETGDVCDPAISDDEIGMLARTLQDSLGRTDAALRELENQKFALDQHAIVAVTDVQGRITYVNGRFCEISGFSVSELLGQDHRILNSGAHSREFFIGLWATIARGLVWHGEIRNRAKNGSFYWVDTTIVPLAGPNGKPSQYIAIRTDITSRKQTEEALIVAKDSAESASRAKSEFLATMSHEIRTPMNGVLGFTNLLLDTPLNPEQRNYTRTIKSSGESLLGLINEILDISKIEAGKLILEPLLLDFAEILQGVTGLMSAQAREKGVDLSVDYPEHLPRKLVADPCRLHQVLFNLIGNALKFTERGSVTVRVSATENAEPLQLRVEVTDTGVGIPKDKQVHLFQKFTQADSSTTRRFGGSGLGLAISKHLIELMGGQVGMESDPGRGSTFWFTLPVTQCANSTAGAPASAPDGSVEISRTNVAQPLNLRILVAEDTRVNQLLVMRLLEKFGCQADIAVNGREAVELSQRQAYDLVLMDCHMPEMSGFEATAEIRRLEQLETRNPRRIPIIALTASVVQEERNRCYSAGMNDFLAKPFQPQDLRQMLVRWSGAVSPTDSRILQHPDTDRVLSP